MAKSTLTIIQNFSAALTTHPNAEAILRLHRMNRHNYAEKLLDAARPYYNDFLTDVMITSQANLDVTFALLDKYATATSEFPDNRDTKLTAQGASRLHASTLLAIDEAMERGPLRKLAHFIRWVVTDINRWNAPIKECKSPEILDQFAQRCLREKDLRHLADAFDINEQRTGNATKYVPAISAETVMQTLDCAKHATNLVDANTGFWRVLLSSVDNAAKQLGLSDDTRFVTDRAALTTRLLYLDQNPKIEALEALAEKLRNPAPVAEKPARKQRTTKQPKGDAIDSGPK
jgi:hypothetical protein